MVVRDMPVASSTTEIPPSPSASASAPAHNRVRRSSMAGWSARNFIRMISIVVATDGEDHIAKAQSILLDS
jgi:hypothetical protein